MLIFSSVEEARNYCRKQRGCKYCDFGYPYGSHYWMCEYVGYDDDRAGNCSLAQLSDEQIKRRLKISK